MNPAVGLLDFLSAQENCRLEDFQIPVNLPNPIFSRCGISVTVNPSELASISRMTRHERAS